MGWSAIASQATTQTGAYQSQVSTAVNPSVDIDTGSITAASNWSSIRDGQAFAIIRSGVVVAVRCAKSVSTTTLTYHRLYLEDGSELTTDVQVGDTIELYETSTEVGSGTALGSVVGVTLTTIGSGPQIGRIFAIGDNRTLISGSFQVSQNDIIYYGSAAPASNLTVNAGGKLVIGSYTTRGGVTNFSDSCSLRGTKSESNSTIAFLLVSNATSRCDWFGGTVEAGGGINDVANATTIAYSKNCIHKSLGTTIFYQIRTSSTGFRTYGLTMDGNGGLIHIGNPNVSGLQAIHCDSVLNLSSSTPANTWLINKGGRLVGGNSVDVAFWSSRWMRVVNQLTGSAVTVGGNSVGGSPSNRGIQEYRQEVNISLTNLTGTPVNGARWICRDVNNGSRLGASLIGTNPDYIADRVYEGTTAADGSSSILSDGGVLTAVAYQNLANVSVTRFQSVVWDRRGLDNSSTDRFRFLISAYGYKPDSAVVILKGVSPALMSRSLIADPNISEVNPSIVSSYSTIANLDSFYDSASLWLSSAGVNMEMAGAGNFLVNGNGTEINLGTFNLTVDPNAAQTFSVTGNTITIKTSTLNSGIKFSTLRTTGTLSLLNGATMGISYSTGSGTFASISINDLIIGSRVQIYNLTDSIEMANFIATSNTYNNIFQWPGVKTVRVRVSRIGRDDYETTGSFVSTGTSFTVSMPIDNVYFVNNINGSIVTEFTANYANTRVDIDGSVGSTSVQRLYAWYHAECETENGIRLLFGAISADDQVNYKINTSVINLKLHNNTSTATMITGARIYSDNNQTVISTTSGPLQLDPLKAYVASSALIQSQLSKISSNATLIPALL